MEMTQIDGFSIPMRYPTCSNFPWIFCQGCETNDERIKKDVKCFVESPWVFQAGVTVS